jgi:hypothetical protein
MPLPEVYRRPAVNWGIPNQIARFHEYDDKTLTIGGVSFDRKEIKIPPDITETIYIERFIGLQEVSLDGESCYPPEFGTEFKFSGRSEKEWAVKGSPFIYIAAILPQQIPAPPPAWNFLTVIAWDYGWSVRGRVMGEALGWYNRLGQLTMQTKHKQLRWGSLAFEGTLQTFAIHCAGRKIPIIFFSPFESHVIDGYVNLSPEHAVTIKLYGALKVYQAIWHEQALPLPKPIGWGYGVGVSVAILDINGELQYVTNTLPGLKQRIIRRLFAFIEPTYTFSNDIAALPGVVSLSWSELEGQLTTYTPVGLGEVIQINIAGDSFVGVVTSVDRTQSGEDNRIVYRVKFKHPALDDTKVLPQKIKLHLLSLSLIIRLFRAMCHYPYPVYLPSGINGDAIIVYDFKNEERSFSNFAEFCDFLAEFLSSTTGTPHFWRVNNDRSISIVSATQTTPVWALPNDAFVTVEVQVTRDISQPNAVIMQNTIRKLDSSIQQEGLRIGVGGRLVTGKVRIKLLGYLPAKRGDKVVLNYDVTGPNWVGWVTEISWNADASGEITTDLEATQYA